MTQNSIFNIIDFVPRKFLETLIGNVSRLSFNERSAIAHHKIKAVWTGGKRKPKAGEWYLSGAIIEAYLAKHNLDTEYHIARLVLIEHQTITKIISTR